MNACLPFYFFNLRGKAYKIKSGKHSRVITNCVEQNKLHSVSLVHLLKSDFFPPKSTENSMKMQP